MKLKLYAVHDQAVNEFIGPEAARTHGEAERRFKANVNNPQNGLLHSNPEHFTLMYVGDYDTENGELTPLKNGPQAMIKALQCKELGENTTRMAAN